MEATINENRQYKILQIDLIKKKKYKGVCGTVKETIKSTSIKKN